MLENKSKKVDFFNNSSLTGITLTARENERSNGKDKRPKTA